MDTQHHDGGMSLGLVIASILLKGLSQIAPSQWWINILTIIMLLLAIAYHILGIHDRVFNLIKRNRKNKIS